MSVRHFDLVAMIDCMETADFLVLCSLVITRAVVDLGPEPAAEFFKNGVGTVARDIAAADAAAAPPKE